MPRLSDPSPLPRRCALLAAVAVTAACGRARPQAPSQPQNAPPPETVLTRAPQLFPPTSGSGVSQAVLDRDGSRRLFAFGMRVLERQDGSMEVGREILPAARTARFLDLPPRLGTGTLFWITSSNTTLLYRARHWTAELEPLAQLDFEVDRLVPGFDRLLIFPKQSTDAVALDPETGAALPVVGLPPAPAYGDLAFVDGWFGAARVPLRSALVTFDAGGTWRPLGLPVTNLDVDGASLALSTPAAELSLGASGVISRVATRDAAQVNEEARAELAKLLGAGAVRGSQKELGARPLQNATLLGFPDGQGGALLASSGSLVRVELATGRIVQKLERAYSGSGECYGVGYGPEGIGFVCGKAQESTAVYGFVSPFRLVKLMEFAGARLVADSGRGALLVRGSCGDDDRALAVCAVWGDGTRREVALHDARQRALALADGRVAVLTPPREGRPGSLALVARNGAETRVALALRGSESKPLLEQGLWLEGLVEGKPGELWAWVVGSGAFVGVHVTAAGVVTAGRVEPDASRALFAGARALSLGRSGLGAETINGGLSWRAVDLPPEIDLDDKELFGGDTRQGCSAIGCVFAGFTRIGYFDEQGPTALPVPETPAPVRFPSPGGGRWILRCDPTGEESAPALPQPDRTTLRSRLARGAVPDEIELAPLAPLAERDAPRLSAEQLGVYAGTDNAWVESRMYAIGPRTGDWSQLGSLTLAFTDRYSIPKGTFASLPGRSPWPDALGAAEALGADPSTNSAALSAAVEAGGAVGALLLNSRGSLDLFVAEAGRAPIHVPNVGRFGLTRLAGVAKTRAGLFVGGYADNSGFRVHRVQPPELVLVTEAVDIPPQRGPNAELVRSVNGDALAIWVRATGWFVHPLEADTGRVEAPLVVTPRELSVLPESCAPEAEGFVLAGEPPLEPNFELPADLRASRVQGRFRVSAAGVCVDELAAYGERSTEAGRSAGTRTRASGASAGATAGRPSVPLILSERGPGARRLGLRCWQ